MNDDTKAVQGDAFSARTTASKYERSSLGTHARRFDDAPISFQVMLPDGSVQRFGKAAPRFAVTLKNSQALRALASLDEGRIGEVAAILDSQSVKTAKGFSPGESTSRAVVFGSLLRNRISIG